MENQIKIEQSSESKENEEYIEKPSQLSSANKTLEEKNQNASKPGSTLSPEEAKVLLYNIKKREKEQKKKMAEMQEEIEDLKFQIDKMQTISNYEGHSNPGQKIKHLLKIKEENNQLKKEM